MKDYIQFRWDFSTICNLFFGQEIAEQFIYLLSQHIIIFSSLVDSMYIGNQQAANLNQSDWYGNAESIAVFMARLNSSWNYQEWYDLLVRYLKMLIDEALAIFSADYRKEIAIYDWLQHHSLRMADYMSRGVMRNLLGNTETIQDR